MLRYAIFALSLCFATAIQASDRVALVIGIAQYQTISPLRNTVNDANALSDTLEQIGFEVTKLTDATGAEINATLDSFSFKAETAELAVIYFAGHGVEVLGENFLIPVDADVSSNADVQAQSISLKQMLAAVDKARKMRIVILDSCRDNPFNDWIDLNAEVTTTTEGSSQTRSVGGGLAAPTPDRGTLVAFAARDGNVALDGAGNNSPFASALVDSLAQPDLEISLMFRRVRDQVLESTNNQQEPFTYGSLPGFPFYLAGENAVDLASANAEDLKNAWSSIRPEDEEQFAKLASAGDTRSMIGLAHRRLNPSERDFDPSAAVKFLFQAAEAGSPEAQYELGTMFESGKGVAQSDERALELYRKAAQQDFPEALNDMGVLHFIGGLGLQKDTDKALGYIERAADQRHPQAMFNYASLIDDGSVSGKSSKDAAQYLYRALRSGYVEVFEAMTVHPDAFEDETWRDLQAIMQGFDFYDGALDGDFGPGTKRGLERAMSVTQ